MNKELELFKRWFEIDIRQEDLYSISNLEEEYDHERKKYIFDFSKLQVSIDTDLLNKEYLLKIINSPYFERILMNYFEENLYFIFKIPPEHGLVEWEQYVKEMKDE